MDALGYLKSSDRLGWISRFVRVGRHIDPLSPRAVPPGDLGFAGVPNQRRFHVSATVVIENASDKQTGRMCAD